MKRRALHLLGALCVLWLAWRGFRLAVGSPRAALAEPWSESTRVYAKDGRLLGERASASGLRGERTTLDRVAPRLVTATLASEDHAFYTHDGVDRAALVRAALTDLRHLRIMAGGSTITSQLVKRLDHRGAARARTLREKVVEVARAQNLEGELDKAQILEAYFNRIDYGRGYAGPEAAARGYFGVSASDVSLAQAALLAVLPRAPSALDPSRHLARAQVRQRALLAKMHERGEVTDAELAHALAEPLVIRPQARRVLVAPHVVLAAGGGDVHTTLDFDLQEAAEAIVKTHAARLRAAGASGAAAIVIDNATGDVLAEVGSADYFDRSAGAVDLVRKKRQAGSTLKPFVYAHAFERGLSPMAPLPDVPTELGTTGAGYAPDNFDGSFAGPVAARDALAGSLNVPAVRLVTQMGATEAVSVLRRTGLELKDGAERYGVSIALGSAEVSPWELAGAYVVLARGGERVAIRDRDAADGVNSSERVLDAASVALVTDALADPLARVRGLRARGAFELNFPVAMKTGTSTGYRDAWTAGYTHERTVVVWVGNPSGAMTNQLTGAMGAGPIFLDLMRRVMRDVSPRAPLLDTSSLETAEVCPLSGLLPGPDCPDRVERRFAPAARPGETCKMHTHAGGQAVVLLPSAYARFLGERPRGAPGLDAHGLPWLLAETDEPAVSAHAEGGGPRVVLVKPRRGAVFHADEAPRGADAVEVIAATEGLPAATPLEILVDGQSRGLLAPPYHTLVAVSRGEHSVEVRPQSPGVVGHVARAEIDVR